MSKHESFRAAGPKNVPEIAQFLANGNSPDTQWSMGELQIATGYINAWPHWNTPLHRMIATKQRDGMAYLLDRGASVHLLNYLGRTPLQEAARIEFHEGAELLLARGADPNMPSQGRTAGNEIGDHDDPEGEDVEVLPIHEALRNGDVRMLQLLAKAGIELNQPAHGWRPLELALLDRQADMMNTLFGLGSRFSPMNENLDYDQDQHKEAARALLHFASHADWFPPPSSHPLFISVLATCKPHLYPAIEQHQMQGFDSNELIHEVFNKISSISQCVNIEPSKDALCPECFLYQTRSAHLPCNCLHGSTGSSSTDCFRHHTNFEDLVSSARSGCRLCRTFIQALNLVKSHPSPVTVVLTKYLQLATTPTVILHFHRPNRIIVTAGHLAAELELSYVNERTIKTLPNVDDYENGTRSLSSFQVAKAWLHNCLMNHEFCDATSAPLPTRVIDVGDGTRDPFLLETKGAYDRYCALSYCWGTSASAHKTTTVNLTRYYRAILPSDLPQTLLDAIHAARSLGFRYIWIDALCIIQDDGDDWAREAVRMTQVYANATLTITTAVGQSSDDGLFRPHPVGFFNPQQFHIRLTRRDRAKPKLQIRDKDLAISRSTHSLSYLAIYPDANFGYIGYAYIGVQNAPIERRAWTLQEQILSRRLLYYGHGAILWECLEASASEHDPDGIRNGFQFPDRFRIKTYLHASRLEETRAQMSAATTVPSVLGSATPFATYCRLLESYSSRSITKPSDRITAILGLGHIMENILKQEFIGGIWKGDHTLASLLWLIEVPSPNERTSSFPTWSWASVVPETEEHRVVNNIGEMEEVDWKTKVVSFDARSDPAQTCVMGSITLEGPLGKLMDDENYKKSLEGTLRTTPYVLMDTAADASALRSDLANVWCLDMLTLKGDSNLPSKVCLLLRQVGDFDDQTFQRIGVYQHVTSINVNTMQAVTLV